MDSYGLNPNPKIPRIPEAEEYLLRIFKRDWSDLLTIAAMDETKRRNLNIALNFPHIAQWGGTVNYCKKTKRFDFIEYSSKGYAKRVDITGIEMSTSSTNIPKHKSHAHYWIEDGVFYESYYTLRGMRYRELKEINLPDSDRCPNDMLTFISAEYY